MTFMDPLRKCAGKTALGAAALVGVAQYQGIAFDFQAEQAIEQIQRERDSTGAIVTTFLNAPPSYPDHSLIT